MDAPASNRALKDHHYYTPPGQQDEAWTGDEELTTAHSQLSCLKFYQKWGSPFFYTRLTDGELCRRKQRAPQKTQITGR